MFRNAVIVFAITLFIYLAFAGRFKFDFPRTNRDYFTRLSSSFLHLKLDIPSPGYSPNDLSYHRGKYYLYWGPLPSIIIAPAVFFLGTNISDIFYTAVFGAINAGLVYLLLEEFKRFNKLKANRNVNILLAFCFVFGTIHFYLSVLGTVWFTSQIMTLTVYLLSLLFLFKYVNNGKYQSLLLSIFFLGAASLGKYTFLFSAPLHFGLLYTREKLPLKKIFPILCILLFFLIVLLGYNFLRFDSPFNNGLMLMQVNSRFTHDLKNFGYFNFYYIWRNLYYFLLNPAIPDPNGNSIFATSPILLLLLYGWHKNYFGLYKKIAWYIFISSVFMMIPVFLYYGGGWYQWGYRYALDIYPLLFLLLLLVIHKFKKLTVSILVMISIAINIFGTLWMMDFAKYAYF